MKKNTGKEKSFKDEVNLLQIPNDEDTEKLMLNDDIELVINAAKKGDDEDEIDDDDDYYHEEDEEKENPFDREPTDKEINDNDIPLVNPEDDLLDDDEEIPLN